MPRHLRTIATMAAGLSIIVGLSAIYDGLTQPRPPRAAPAPTASPTVPLVVVPPVELTTDGLIGPKAGTNAPLRPDAGPNPTSGFVHPGILVSRGQLDELRDRLREGRQPWAGAFRSLLRSPFASMGWEAHPRAEVECGYYSRPDNGCSDEWRDATAAYTQALLWYLTLNERHAQKAIEIIDAWSQNLRSHTGQNAPLQAGWSAATMVRAAEIVRFTYQGWTAETGNRVKAMFRNIYLPLVRNGAPRGSEGNWDFIMLDAAIGISVYLDDRPLFDSVVQRWRSRLPAYIYLAGDGPTPVPPPGGTASRSLVEYWHGQTTYVTGLAQETCRDLGHTGWGLEALSHVAETAWLQQVDLYAEAQDRLVPALELYAGLSLGRAVPGWLCGGTTAAAFTPIPEIAFNHLHNRLGISMPRTQELLQRDRPQQASHFFGWETLTAAGMP